MINLEFKLNQIGGNLFFVKIDNEPRPITVNMALDSRISDVITFLKEKGYDIDFLEKIESNGIKRKLREDLHLNDYNLKNEGFLNGKIMDKIPIDKRLINATFEGNIEEIEMIINEAKENSIELIMEVREHNDHQKTLIHYASRKGFYEILLIFKNVIGDDNFRILVNIPDNENRTPLMMACRGTFVKNEESLINTINLLLSNMDQYQKNVLDINGNSALKFAINSSVSNRIASIIYNSVDPTINDFISKFYGSRRGIDVLVDQYSLNKSFLLDKFMIDFVGIDWDLLKQKVKN